MFLFEKIKGEIFEIYRRKGLSTERENKYLQTTHKTAAISTIGS